MQLEVNDTAPLFEATKDDGSKFVLADLIGKSAIVLYFYPKDFTPGCTKEACSFRDEWDKIQALGATVVGVSSDDQKRHAEFRKKYSLPFTLVTDTTKSIRKIYGATSVFLPPRTTFVIDRAGKIRRIFDSQLGVTKHVEEALRTLGEISTFQAKKN